MKQFTTSRTLYAATLCSILVLTVAACDTDELVGECEDLSGTFVATDFDVVSAVDPALVADFDPTATYRLQFSGNTFTSTFNEPDDAPLAVTGEFEVDDDEVLLLSDEPLLPGAAGERQAFLCGLDDGVLTLTTETLPFDFDLDGIFETAIFEATFVRQ